MGENNGYSRRQRRREIKKAREADSLSGSPPSGSLAHLLIKRLAEVAAMPLSKAPEAQAGRRHRNPTWHDKGCGGGFRESAFGFDIPATGWRG
jgi:hypothetical protein